MCISINPIVDRRLKNPNHTISPWENIPPKHIGLAHGRAEDVILDLNWCRRRYQKFRNDILYRLGDKT